MLITLMTMRVVADLLALEKCSTVHILMLLLSNVDDRVGSEGERLGTRVYDLLMVNYLV